MTFETIDLGDGSQCLEEAALQRMAEAGLRVALVTGGCAEDRAHALTALDARDKDVVLVELGTECLAFHTGERLDGSAKVLGFSRFRLGAMAPSGLVELVRPRHATPDALAAARSLFQAAGLEVAVCADQPGRIVDSLLRPYLNAALRSVDEGLATPGDLDTALRMGLGYPRGPMQLLEDSGLAAHGDVSSALYEALGDPGFLPARAARNESMRKKAGLG